MTVLPATLFFCCLALAQPASQVSLEGYSGTAELLVNYSLHQTVLVLSSADPISKGSKQMVLVFPHSEKSDLPKEWSSPAKVLVGNGLVAVNFETGTRVLFKFQDRAVPASLNKPGLQSYEILGIARYGDPVALTRGQITSLNLTGSLPVGRE